VIGSFPLQLPFETDSVSPCLAVPEVAGEAVLCGAERGMSWITAVGVEVADAF
jgi:hypothetical protein